MEVKPEENEKNNQKTMKTKKTLSISEDHDAKLRIHCAIHRISQSKWVEQAIDTLIPSNKYL